MKIGGEFGRRGVPPREQKRYREAPSMQFPEHQLLPLPESVPSQGQPAISIAKNHVHAGEEEDQVGSASVEDIGEIFPQEIEVLEITAMIRQRNIKITGWFSHRKIPAAMH